MIYTFYSFKGGVGRSMALANAAELLRQRGIDVLVVDWDLEAPGLERFFPVDVEKVLASTGVVDLIQEYKKRLSRQPPEPAPETWPMPPLGEYVFEVHPSDPAQKTGRLVLLPAGCREGKEFTRYSLLVRTFDWQDFYQNWEGELFFEQLRRQFLKLADTVLIDSRTGVTEMGGVCTYQIADAVVMLCAANQQNLDGCSVMASNFTRPEVAQLRPGRPLDVLVVPARVDDRAEIRDLNEFRRSFLEKFKRFLRSPWIDDPERFFKEAKIPHVPGYAFKELVAAREMGDLRSDDMLAAFICMTQEMARLAPPGSPVQKFLHATQETTYDAFFCASAGVKEWAARLEHKLKADIGLRLFIPEDEIRPGEKFIEALKKGLQQSRACVVLVGSEELTSIDQQIVGWALSRAQEDSDFLIVPLLLPGAQPDLLPYELKSRHFVDFRLGIDDEQGFRSLVRGLKALSLKAEAPIKSEMNPYRGPTSFYEENYKRFFGRENEIHQFLSLLRSNRVVAIVGPPGVGKTSFVMAGVLPALRAGHIPELAEVPVAVFRPANEPFERMFSSLLPLLKRDEEDVEALGAALKSGKTRLREIVSGLHTGRTSAPYCILVIDSFEEMYFGENNTVRQRFVDEVTEATSDGSVVAIVVVRADFLDQITRNFGGGQQLAKFILQPLTRHQLLEAIERPAASVGLKFERGLVERIVNEFGDEPVPLPLLQLLLNELWTRRQDDLLTHQAYESIGSVKGILAQRAEAAFESLPEAQKKIARSLFLQMLQPAAEKGYTRRQVRLDQLLWPTEVLDPVVEQLTQAGIVVIRHNEMTGAKTIEIAHDLFLQGWNKLQEWAAEDRAFLSWRQQLDLSVNLWERSGRDVGGLLSGPALVKAEIWLREIPEVLDSREIAYIQGSAAHRREEEVRLRLETRRLRFLIGTSSVSLLAGALFFYQFKSTDRQFRAYRQRTLAIQVQMAGNERNQLGLSVLLGAESIRQLPSGEMEDFLRQKLSLMMPLVNSIGAGFGTTVSSAAFSPDWRSLVTGGRDGILNVRDLSSEQPIQRELPRLEGPVNSVAFSPDGRYVAAGGHDGAVMLIGVAMGGRGARSLRGRAGAVRSIAFSPDGRFLATASDHGAVTVWDAASGSEIASSEIDRSSGGTACLAWSPDGKRVAACSGNRLTVGDPFTWRKPLIFVAQVSAFTDVAWSKDGRYLATVDDNGTAILWEAKSGLKLQSFLGRHGIGNAVAFSPNAELLATADGDGTTTVWALKSNSEIGVAVEGSETLSLAFWPDSSSIATAGRNGSVRVWGIPSGAGTGQQVSHLSNGELIAEVCRRVTRNLTPDEWKQYLGNEAYRKTCPNLP